MICPANLVFKPSLRVPVMQLILCKLDLSFKPLLIQNLKSVAFTKRNDLNCPIPARPFAHLRPVDHLPDCHCQFIQ